MREGDKYQDEELRGILIHTYTRKPRYQRRRERERERAREGEIEVGRGAPCTPFVGL